MSYGEPHETTFADYACHSCPGRLRRARCRTCGRRQRARPCRNGEPADEEQEGDMDPDLRSEDAPYGE